MIVQHNISALNAHRNLSINNNATAANLEKLSSGYRINRAADDAAGLAISEKMRGQIRGLAMAENNVDNAIHLIQTAEGGLNEVHDILHRMRELAVQSANGTYDNENDRYNLNKELEALKSEIDRISVSTHYNGINLLDGTLGAAWADLLPGGEIVNSVTSTTYSYDNGTAGALADTLTSYGFVFDIPTGSPTTSIGGAVWITTQSSTLDGSLVNLLINHVTDINGQTVAQLALQVGDQTYMAVFDTTDGYVFYDNSGQPIANLCYRGSSPTYLELDISNASPGIITNIQLSDDGTNETHLFNTPTNPVLLSGGFDVAIDPTHPLYSSYFANKASELMFQIGANGTADQRVGLHVDNMSSFCLGTFIATIYNEYGTIAGVSVADQDEANDAIFMIDAAVNQVSATRADLGALQNRLDHTMNSLGVTKENLTAAESTIRDVDMAKEMMEFTKNSILIQAAQAMLAQAQALPQGVLQLLQ